MVCDDDSEWNLMTTEWDLIGTAGGSDGFPEWCMARSDGTVNDRG